MLWTDDDYLGPLHVQTSDGTRGARWASCRSGPGCSTVPEVYAKSIAHYGEPAKAFLDALGRVRRSRRRGRRSASATRARTRRWPRTGWSTTRTAPRRPAACR